MINVSNLYYMLAYAYQSISEKALRDVEGEAFEHVYDLMAAILKRGVSTLVRRGLRRDYLAREEATASPRGSIDFAASLRANTLRRRELCCRCDEYTEDIPVNRALKATMRLLLTQETVKPENRAALKRLTGFFVRVRDVRTCEIDWNALRTEKRDRQTRALLGVCELTLKHLMMSERAGDTRLRSVEDAQYAHRLYEKFLLNYFKTHYPCLNPCARHIDWDVGYASDASLLPVMKTDITLRHGVRTLIIDAKYYAHSTQYNAMYDRRSLISNHLYQLYAYVQNADTQHSGDVSGMLLYARTDDPLAPDGDYVIGRNPFFVRSLDLSREWSEIRGQLDGIARAVLDGSLGAAM